MIVMAVISKMLYFSITVIAAKLWAPNRQAQEEPAFMGLLCILPIFSVIVSAVVVYIGVRAEMTKPVELLMINCVDLADRQSDFYGHIQPFAANAR